MNNPTRRNRNIGTSKQGRGTQNKFRIADPWWDGKVFYERLHHPVTVSRTIHDAPWTFLVEPVLSDFAHVCTIDDICKVLHLLPADDVAGINIVVLRQPKRKEIILNRVWGRLVYYYESDLIQGPAIILEAQTIRKHNKWPKSLKPEAARELEQLAQDGHQIRYDRNHIEIISSYASCRATQLYRTLPHEVGHYVDYHRIKNPVAYESKPDQEKEIFAHRYAEGFTEQALREGRIPFESIVIRENFERDNLDIGWFAAADGFESKT